MARIRAVSLLAVTLCIVSCIIITSASIASPPSLFGKSIASPLSSSPKYQIELLPSVEAAKERKFADGTETIPMTAANGQKYQCLIPPPTTSQSSVSSSRPSSSSSIGSPHKEEEAEDLRRTMAVLRGTCFYRMAGWWMYEFCYHGSIRQFHQEEKKVVAEFYLGHFNHTSSALFNDQDISSLPKHKQSIPALTGQAPQSNSPLKKPGSLAKQSDDVVYKLRKGDNSPAATNAFGEHLVSSATVELDPNNPTKLASAPIATNSRSLTAEPYISEIYTDGTPCDLTGQLRETEVRYYCANEGVSFIADVQEPATCKYTMTFKYDKLCQLPGFKKTEDPVDSIVCIPEGSPPPPPASSDIGSSYSTYKSMFGSDANQVQDIYFMDSDGEFSELNLSGDDDDDLSSVSVDGDELLRMLFQEEQQGRNPESALKQFLRSHQNQEPKTKAEGNDESAAATSEDEIDESLLQEIDIESIFAELQKSVGLRNRRQGERERRRRQSPSNE